MNQIYYLVLACILAVGVFVAGLYWSEMIERYKRYRRKLARTSLKTRVEQLEKRVELHTRKDGTYLDKFDEIDEQLNNMAEMLSKRENRLKYRVREETKKYLKELSK